MRKTRFVMRSGMRIKEIFAVAKPIIGMVHLKPLPGSPDYQPDMGMPQIIAAALEDADRLVAGGIDGMQIENQGDWPFLKPDDIGCETVAAVTAVATQIRARHSLPMGINIHLNGVCQALAIAQAANCQWVRAFELANAYVSSSGIIEAAGPRALRYRKALQAENDIMIFGDFHVKFGSHRIVDGKSLVEQARDVAAAMADAVIVSGRETGMPPRRDEIAEIRSAVPTPLLIGSGLARENLEELLPLVDGAIVGSFFKVDGKTGNPVDITRVRDFMQAVRALS